MNIEEIIINPIGYAKNSRDKIEDDHWGQIETKIILNDEIPLETLTGIEQFSHLEIIYFFHLQDKDKVILGAEHPRENPNWPKVGIFAQRKKARPNRLGATIVELKKIEGRTLYVKYFDGLNNTPVLDIKPVMKEFLPDRPIRQPDWTTELMKNYW